MTVRRTQNSGVQAPATNLTDIPDGTDPWYLYHGGLQIRSLKIMSMEFCEAAIIFRSCSTCEPLAVSKLQNWNDVPALASAARNNFRKVICVCERPKYPTVTLLAFAEI